MTTAFHFRADDEKYGGVYGWPIEDMFFRTLLAGPSEDSHLEIFVGDLLVHQIGHDQDAREAVLQGLLGYSPRRWSTLEHTEFSSALFAARIYVLAVEGLSRSVQDYLDSQLRRDGSYLGALEIDASNQVHWALYTQSLIPRYRYVNGEIRLFYRRFEEEEGADAKDEARAESLRRLPFRSVTWEDIGVRHTIFDSYRSFQHAKRLAELEIYLSGHLARVADEILLRADALDPRLKDTLYAALRTFDRIETAEESAQVAVSCRRFLKGLADALYPPRKEPVEGRSVGPEAYRNRLWAYVEEKLKADERELVLTQLEDIGNRVDKLDKLSQKGVHDRITRSDLHRLIVALLVLAYDLFSLAEPPKESSLEPYSEEIVAFARELTRQRPGSPGKAGR